MEHRRNPIGFFICLIVFMQLFAAATAEAEDGYRLWLRYDPLLDKLSWAQATAFLEAVVGA